MHKQMVVEPEKKTKNKKRQQTFARKANFDVGDYVLRSRVDQKHYDKLLVTWIGPYQVIGADEHSFKVKHLVTGRRVTSTHLAENSTPTALWKSQKRSGST